MSDTALGGKTQEIARIQALVKNQNMIEAVAYVICRDFHLAQDIYQEVALILAEKWEPGMETQNLGPWLREVTRRKSLELLRKHKRIHCLLPEEVLVAMADEVDPGDGDEKEDPEDYLHEVLGECLDKLHGVAREIVLARYGENRSDGACEAIARKLGRTVPAVYSILNRARLSLTECLRRARKGGWLSESSLSSDTRMDATSSAYYSGTITDEEMAALGRLLSRDAAARRLLVQAGRLDLRIHRVVKSRGWIAQYAGRVFESEQPAEAPAAAQPAPEPSEEPGEVIVAMPRPVGDRFFRRGAWATAAGILLALGIGMWNWREPAERPVAAGQSFYEIVKQVGNVSVVSNQISTGKGSGCLVRYRDGSRVAIGQNARVNLVDETAGQGKRIELGLGPVFVDAVRQSKALTVLSDDVLMEAIGTRFVASRSTKHVLAVVDGKVRFARPGASACVHAGQMLGSPLMDAGKPGPMALQVATVSPGSGELAWLDALGIREVDVLADMARAGAGLTPANPEPDIRSYRIVSGNWQVDPAAGIIRQESSGEASIKFEEPRHQRGVVSLRFKILKVHTDIPYVDLTLDYRDGVENFGVSRSIQELAREYEWLRMDMAFEIGAGNTVLVRMSVWPEQNAKAIREFEFFKGPHNTRFAKNRDVAAIGLVTRGTDLEVRDFKITEGRPPRPLSRSVGRLPGGLLALYQFDQGRDIQIMALRGGAPSMTRMNRVIDVSGSDQPMDLTIYNTDMIEWLSDGLHVKGPADIRAVGDLKPLRDAWRKNRALTVEYWVRSRTLRPVDGVGRQLATLSAGDGSSVSLTIGSLGDDGIGKIHHIATIWEDADGKARARVMTADGRTNAVHSAPGAFSLHARRPPIDLCFLPVQPRAAGRNAVECWTGDILAIAIYDRALTREEFDANTRAGVPVSGPGGQ